MTKEILSFELCKRLYDAGVRKEIDENNYYYYYGYDGKENYGWCSYDCPKYYPFSIVDGLELIPYYYLNKYSNGIIINLYPTHDITDMSLKGKTLKEVVEKSLVYLLDNGLIGNTK